jgi:salicylate hydroxylase
MAMPIDIWDLRDGAIKVVIADGINSSAREHLFPGSKAVLLSDKIFRSLAPSPNENEINMDCVNLWLHPGGHVVHYPVGANRLLNLVAVTQGSEPAQHFANASPLLQEVLQSAKSWTTWPAAYVPPLQRWDNGPCLLIGDAAHGTVPYLAQGAAMALEDAAALKKTSVNFKATSLIRNARTRRLHNASRQQGKIYHADGLTRLVAQTALCLLPEALAWSRLAWLYNR